MRQKRAEPLKKVQSLLRASLVAQLVKNACSAGGPDSFPGSGRSPGEGRGNPRQYSCLGNSTDRGAWQATVHGVANESDTTERLHFQSCGKEFDVQAHRLRSRMLTCTRVFCVNPRESSLGTQVHLCRAWGPCISD